MTFIDKWALFGGYFVFFSISGVLKNGLYFQADLYLEVVFSTSFPDIGHSEQHVIYRLKHHLDV
jgi:hypothetical protein